MKEGYVSRIAGKEVEFGTKSNAANTGATMVHEGTHTIDKSSNSSFSMGNVEKLPKQNEAKHYDELEIKKSHMKHISLSIFLLSNILTCLSGLDNSSGIDSRIVAWTINFYKENSIKVSEADLHFLLIEKIKTKNGTILSLFSVGRNITNVRDIVLVFDGKKSGMDAIMPFGKSDFQEDLTGMYDFFEESPYFSDKIKVICYEKLISGSGNRIFKKK